MVERFTFGGNEQQTEIMQADLCAENLRSDDRIAYLPEAYEAYMHRNPRLEQFDKSLQQALEILKPILEGINKLPNANRHELLASITNMDGPAYEMIRKHCAA